MRRTRVRWRRVAAMGFAAAALVGVAGRAAASGGSGHGARPHPARLHVVDRGDTLPGVPTRLTGPAADPRPLGRAIRPPNPTPGPRAPAPPPTPTRPFMH